MNSMVKTLPKMYTKKNKCPARGLDETVQTWQMVIEQKGFSNRKAGDVFHARAACRKYESI